MVCPRGWFDHLCDCRRGASCLLVMAALSLPHPAAATTVYRSVGDDGVVVFSDQPPAAGTTADVLEVAVSTAHVDADERLRELRATNDRLAQARRRREAARAGSADPVIRYTAAPAEPDRGTDFLSRPHVLWPYPAGRARYRGPLRLRPAPPVAVPPGFQVIQPGNHQLMRPIVSSRD